MMNNCDNCPYVCDISDYLRCEDKEEECQGEKNG